MDLPFSNETPVNHDDQITRLRFISEFNYGNQYYVSKARCKIKGRH